MLTRLARTSASTRTTLLSLVLLAGSAAVTLVLGAHPRVSTTAGVITALVVAAAFYLAEQHLINFEFRRQSHSVTFAGVPMAIGVLLLPVGELVVARLVGSLLALLIQRMRPQKLLYNVCAYCFEAALVGAAVGAFAPTPAHLGVLEVVGMIACAVVVDQVMSALVLLVIRMHGGQLTHREVAEILVPSAALSSLATTLGVALVMLGEDGAIGKPLDAVLVAAGILGYRAYAGTLRQHRTLATVHRFVTASAGAGVVIDAAQRSLAEIRSVLGASSVEILLRAGDAAVADDDNLLRIRVDEHDDVSTQSATLPRTDWVRSRALHLSEPTLATRRGDPAVVSWLQHEGLQDAIVVPLQSGDDVLGTVTVTDRLAAHATFRSEDLTLLLTLTSHLAVSVRSARLFEKLSHQATHDTLTGLVNRAELAARIESVGQAETPTAVLLLDLDKFKEVNDVLGHEVGDQLLVVIARRLRDALPPSTTIARLGGDEFAILIPELGGDEAQLAEKTARRLVAAILEPVRFADALISPEASIGVALTSVVQPQDLLRCADTAMYVAKARDDSVAMYHPDMDRGRADRLALVADLRFALEHSPEQFAVYYQPQVDLASGEVVGAEALVRWLHPTRGLVGPDRFIPLAEATGLIDKLTCHVLTGALADCARWHRGGHEVGVAVNLSPRNLGDDAIVERVDAALRAAQASAGWLTLEITETVMMQDPGRAVRVLTELAALGVDLSLDDFGTGYSSLAYLQRLPVNELKIDKSFVAALSGEDARNSVSLFRSITALAGNLDLRVVAEGVETPEQFAAVAEMGAAVGQGYLISRPLPAPDFLSWLDERHADRRADLRLVATSA